jgi:hypothetical protein
MRSTNLINEVYKPHQWGLQTSSMGSTNLINGVYKPHQWGLQTSSMRSTNLINGVYKPHQWGLQTSSMGLRWPNRDCGYTESCSCVTVHGLVHSTNCNLQREAVESSWNVMAHGDAREKWRGNKRLEWVTSKRHVTAEHRLARVVQTLQADVHSSPASSRLNWRPPADLNGLVRFAERRNLVSVHVPSHFKRSLPYGK